jgi:hypothetical protein
MASNNEASDQFGFAGTDLLGCGAPLPGFGELLLGPLPAPALLGTAPVLLGAGQFSVTVPNSPTAVGIEILFQAANADLGGFGVELSNDLRSTSAP